MKRYLFFFALTAIGHEMLYFEKHSFFQSDVLEQVVGGVKMPLVMQYAFVSFIHFLQN